MITRNFNLYLNAGHSVPLVINVNQYDSGEQWVFTLYNADGTKYTPSTGAIVGIKSDGFGIINSGSVVDGKVVINETQQMTAAVGKAVFELMIDSQTHGTANFVVLVEEKPGNNADLSESDLSLLQEAIDATSPLPTGGSVGQVLTKTANGSAWSDAGTPTQEQVADAVSDWADEHITVSTGVVIDTSLSVAGAAADAKKTGDEITDLKSQLTNGVPYAVKQALDNILQNVAFKNNDVYTSDLATVHTWATSVNVTSISAVYTQSGTVYDTDSLDSLKADLVVTAYYDNGTSETVTTYSLSGTLAEGTSTITATYGGKSATFDVTVTEEIVLLYDPSTDGLLSAQSYVQTGDTFSTYFTETIVDDALRVQAPANTNYPSSFYKFVPNTYSTSAYMKVIFKIADTVSMSSSNTQGQGTPSFALSGGSEIGGATVGLARYNNASGAIRKRYTVGDTTSWGTEVSTNEWHTIEMAVNNGKQMVKFDDSTLVDNANLATLWNSANRISMALGNKAIDFSIQSIEIRIR